MAVKNTVNAIELSSFASSSVTAGYQVINASGTSNSCYRLLIINDSTADITISFDGVTNHDYVLTATSRDLPAQNYAQPPNWVAQWEKGTHVYIKGTAGTGNIYLSGYYVER